MTRHITAGTHENHFNAGTHKRPHNSWHPWKATRQLVLMKSPLQLVLVKTVLQPALMKCHITASTHEKSTSRHPWNSCHSFLFHAEAADTASTRPLPAPSTPQPIHTDWPWPLTMPDAECPSCRTLIKQQPWQPVPALHPPPPPPSPRLTDHGL